MNTNHQHMGDHSNHNHGGDGGHHNHSGQYDYTAGMTHDFVAHADYMLGNDILAEGQEQYGGYAFLGENTIIARSPITGLRPVIDQAIRQIVGNRTVEEAAQRLGGNDKLESAIAQQLTNLNDWQQLQTETQNEIMIMTGINFDAMTNAEREMTINHLQHSPLPFGDIKEVLSTSVKIDMGFTHTLDKNKTEVEDLGDGIWKIYMISNNNNGSHTGHKLGSFKVDLGENADATIAKQIGNQMVTNTNNNAKLYLDAAARDVLYGKVEKVDFGHNDHEHSETPGKGHSFVEHVQMMYSETLIENQEATGGYAFISDDYIIARSTITGLKPVVEQAIQQIVGNRTLDQAAQRLGGYDKLESAIAQQITNLNDWEQLTEATQANLMIMTGVNFDGLTKAEREASINHLLHSPLPFGAIEGVLSSGVKIELGYTHTLDKNKTEVEDLGDGIWEITLISNNNNGSHTGHNMGSFKVDLGENADATIAKQIGNQMVTNTNNNAKLYLDAAARDVLYGKVEKVDFGHNDHEHSETPGKGHSFVEHVQMMYSETLIENQEATGGYAFISDDYIIARSTITGLKPVVEQAIQQIVGNRTLDQAAQRLGGYDKLESAIAQQITNLNDWEQLTEATQANLMIMTGVNFDGLTKAEREASINHLLHSPLPFGAIEGVLSSGVKIELGYTHTLDKNKTEVEDLGDGIWEITLISNNNNGSHTGHNMGSFKVDLGENADATIAKQIGNQMVTNTNNNAKLYLDQAARDVLYGNTDKTDFDLENPFQSSAHSHDEVSHMQGTDGDDEMMMEGSAVFMGSAGNDMIMGSAEAYNQVDYAGAPADYVFYKNDDGSITVIKPNGTDTLTYIDAIWFNGSAEWMGMGDLAVDRPEEPVEETPVEEEPVEETPEEETPVEETPAEETPVDETPVTEEPTEVAMEGTDGNDYLFGTAGDDLIDLGLGLDVVNGSAGNDVIKGGDNGYNQIDYDGGPVDYAFYANADGSVTVKKPDGTDTLTDIGGVWFKGSQEWFTIDQLVANTPAPEAGTDDYLIGTDGDDMLDAGAGMDVFRGSMGNDMLDGGGSEYDQIDYAGSREDYSIVAKDGGYLVTKANGDTDMLMDIEGIWFAGSNEWNYIEDTVDSE